MKIAIFGVGYVGLVTGVCFAEVGNSVDALDIDPERINNLKKGVLPIYEPNLDKLIEKNLQSGNLRFTTNFKQAILDAEVIFISVGTPMSKTGIADISYVLQAATTIARHLRTYKVIVNKSTVPMGTEKRVSQRISKLLNQYSVEVPFDVVSNPEFLKEGNAVFDCMNPDRIIIGSSSAKAINIMKSLYSAFDPNNNRLMIMDPTSAEMTKYAANAMLATRISFMNEMSQIAERVGADIHQVRSGIGADKRIGSHFISPGCGYGGSCFPKDIQALNQISLEYSYQARLLQAVNNINIDQKNLLFNKFYEYFNGDVKGKTISVWGLSFKPNTDDIREAPSITLIERLWKHGVKVQAYDPKAMTNFAKLYSNDHDYLLSNDPYEVLNGSEALFILTEWDIFCRPNFHKMKEKLRRPIVFDGRNLFDKQLLIHLSFDYICVGR